MLGRLGDHDVGRREQVGGAHGQQPGVTRAAADERHPAAACRRSCASRWRSWVRDWARVMRSCLSQSVTGCSCGVVRASVGAAPRRRASSLARRLPTPAASAGSPVADIRTAQRRRRVRARRPAPRARRPSLALDDLGQRPDRGGAAGLERGEHRALGGDGRAGVRVVEGRRTSRGDGRRRRGLDRQRALAGRGQHLQRVEHLGGLVEPAEPGQPGAGEHDGVVRRRRATLRIRVSTLPRIVDDLQAEAEGVQLGGAARRAGADPAPAGSSPRVRPSRATSDVARVLARGHGGEREAGGRRGRAGP